MLKISFAGFLGLSRMVPALFTLKYLSQPEIAKNSLKTPILGFKVIYVGTTRKVVSSDCYDKQQVCVYLQTFSR